MPIAAPSAGDRILNTDLGAFYNLLKGVAGSGEAITLVYNAAGVIAFIPSSDPAASTQLFQIKNAASTVKSALTAGGGAVFSSVINTAKSSDIASSGTTDLSTATGNYAQISGTTTITAFGTVQAGTIMVLEFQGILTLTHNGTSLILRSGANATTAAGDIYIFVSEGSGNWRELSHLTATASVLMTPLEPTYWSWSYDGTYAPSQTTDVTGTGSIAAVAAVPARDFATGATSGSTAASRTVFGITSNFAIGKVRRWELGLNMITIDANTNAYWLVTTENADGVPTLTPNHIGIKNLAGVVRFTTADGSTEQTTDVSAFVTQNQQMHHVATFDGTTAKLYIDGTLRATHATNVPISTMNNLMTFKVYIANTSAANKSFRLMNTRVDVATS